MRASAATRAAVETDFGFERHIMRGRASLQARTMLAVAVMTALGHVRAGRPGHLRSLVGAIPDTE